MMARYVFAALVVAFVVWVAVALADGASGDPPADGTTSTSSAPAPLVVTVPDPVAELKVAALRRRLTREHGRYLAARRRVHALTRTLAHRTSTREAIELACSVYGNCSTLWRRAGCESHYNPGAHNASGASGLYQFLPATFATTPFASFSIWSPYANALAAGWMMTHGRGGEWVCR
jgi:hypothetical protein